MTFEQLEQHLASLGVKSVKAIRAAGLWLAICPRGVGVGACLEEALVNMVSIIERAPVCVFDESAV